MTSKPSFQPVPSLPTTCWAFRYAARFTERRFGTSQGLQNAFESVHLAFKMPLKHP